MIPKIASFAKTHSWPTDFKRLLFFASHDVLVSGMIVLGIQKITTAFHLAMGWRPKCKRVWSLSDWLRPLLSPWWRIICQKFYSRTPAVAMRIELVLLDWDFWFFKYSHSGWWVSVILYLLLTLPHVVFFLTQIFVFLPFKGSKSFKLSSTFHCKPKFQVFFG